MGRRFFLILWVPQAARICPPAGPGFRFRRYGKDDRTKRPLSNRNIPLRAGSSPEAMLRAALQLQQTGRRDEAIAAYERLLAHRPALPDAWYNLAYELRKAGRFDEALAAYQQALDRGIARPEEIHLNRAVIYSEHLLKDDAAEREVRTALRLKPDFIPALFNLGNLEENRGRKSEAGALYKRVLALDAAHYEALARYANMQIAWKAGDPLIEQLARAIARPGATSAERAALGFALGSALDSIGDYDRAFAAYAAANYESRKSSGNLAAPYNRRAHEDLISELIAAFPQARPGGPGAGSRPPPIFICGMFRSGSTLTEQILASHARVTAGGELDLLPRLARTELAPYPSSMSQIEPARLDHIAARYLEQVSALFPKADVVTDKRPDNFLYIGLIKSLFPDAKIVNTTRHPLDNSLSVYFLNLDHSMAYALDLLDTGHYYRQYRRLMSHWKSLFGADILDFDYDAFVREPRLQASRLLEFCGLDWDENCLSFHRNDNAVRTASAWQVREPLYSRSSGRWQNYERHLAPLREYLGEYLADLMPPQA